MMDEMPRLFTEVGPPRAAVLLAVLLCVCATPSAYAHQLRVFAAADGEFISGSAYFAGGAAARGIEVRIESAEGALLGTTLSDADGRFRWQASAPSDHAVVVQSADGHRARWLVSGAELAPAFAGRPDLSASDQPAGSRMQQNTDAVLETRPGPAPAQAGEVLEPALAAAIERAVARQVRPLREELAEARARARLQDVLGGIGYIVGVAGLALWWRARGQQRSGAPRG